MKKRASKITVSVAVPNDTILSNRVGVARSAFDKLQNIRCARYTYTLSAKRLRNIFNSPKAVGEVVAAIKEEHGSELHSLKVNAKGEGEEPQIYDLLQHSLTQTVVFYVPNISSVTPEDFLSSLSTCYRANKHNLVKYIPSSPIVIRS